VRGRARIVAAASARGTDLVEAYAEPPFSIRPTGVGVVHLVAAAAGPVGGDELELVVVVRAGARLAVRSTGASLVMPGRGGQRSSSTVRIVVEEDASLDWGLLPTILVGGCHHVGLTTIELAGSSTLRWREDLVVGRHDEERPKWARSAVRVTRAGRPLVHHELDVGEEAPGWDGPCVLAGRRAVSTELTVGAGGESACGSGRTDPPGPVLGADPDVRVELAEGVHWSVALRRREDAAVRVTL